MRKRHRWSLLLALPAALCRPAVGEDPPQRKDGPEEEWATPIPAYDDPYKDGLYTTIVTLLTIGAPEIKKQKEVSLRIPDWKKKLDVRAIMQDQPAPLVVVIVGVDGKADTPMGRLLPYWMDKYLKYHVLSFDSTFRPAFEDASRHGVAGYIPADTQAIAQVVAEFLKQGDVAKKVTQIGVVGYCLGAMQALDLARLAAESKLPFQLAGAVGFSPPVRLKTTARILDDFYTTDRWKYTMIDMGKVFLTHEPVAPGAKIPFEPAFMRAGIGFIVREEFTEIVDRNDSIFRLKLLPDPDKDPGVNRRSHAEAWGFVRFMEWMSYPYWRGKGAVRTAEDLWRAGDLFEIMKSLPPYARAVICADDPFNSPEELAELRKAVDPKHLTVLPHGGHIGYIGTAFTFAHLAHLFRFR
jgi:predicted alpha/beta-fold hydrolase